MALEIEWTKTAEDQLEGITSYLEANWTEKEIKQFFRKLEGGIETISAHPKQQKKSIRKEGTYEYQLSPHTTIFYSFNKVKVTVLLLWSNKMDPSKL